MNRTFECMISTLYKACLLVHFYLDHPLTYLQYPWFAVKLYTMRQAFDIFTAFKKQLDVLVYRVTAPGMPREVGLDNKLLLDLIFAGLNAPGFTERQKAQIIEACSVVGSGFPLSKHAPAWPFQTLATCPQKLSDQDVAMWLEILDIGMGVIESREPPFIGIGPYLQVIRDENGRIIFIPMEEGLDLKRAQFTILEKRMMADMMGLGWYAYQRGMGIEPTYNHQALQGISNNLHVGAAQVDPGEHFENQGDGDARPATGAYHLNANGQREAVDNHANNANLQIDYEFIEAGDAGEDIDSFNDPAQALAAMREVVNEVRDAPPIHSPTEDVAFDPEAGLGTGLSNMKLSDPGSTSLQPANLNPESQSFQPVPDRPHQVHFASTFAAAGIGNGNFTTSPPRMDTRRGADDGNNGHQGNGKENALTAPAAGVRLQTATSMPVLAPSPFASGGQVNQASPVSYGLMPPSVAYAPVPPNQDANRERRGVTIRDPNDGNTLTTLLPTSAVETAPAPPTGPAAATIQPGNGPALLRARTRPGNENNRPTDGSAETVEDVLDTLFGYRTNTLQRMGISAGMNMATTTPPSDSRPTTPEPRPSANVVGEGASAFTTPTQLRHSPGRGNLRVRYEFDERLPPNTLSGMPVAQDRSDVAGPSAQVSMPNISAVLLGSTVNYGATANLTSAPTTPAAAYGQTAGRTGLYTPIRAHTRSQSGSALGSGVTYRSVSTADPETTGGVRLPRGSGSSVMGTRTSMAPRLRADHVTPVPVRSYDNTYGGVGDGSPVRTRRNAAGGGPFAGASMTDRVTLSEGTPAARAEYLETLRESRAGNAPIGEDEEYDS